MYHIYKLENDEWVYLRSTRSSEEARQAEKEGFSVIAW
jgi:hypothetical protein